ncbi:unnamed protein product [Trifolium pratense]|uniref:Uncharacterized protein n=1 Tax=Trifolium pratense TaxID=57577 RepID=A0ACB0JFM6_TRIPR|nr:unnamed protein product [Trifolium pratense]
MNENPPNIYNVTFSSSGNKDSKIRETHTFEFSLTDFNDCTTTQITLPNELSTYVRDFNFKNIILEVPKQNNSKFTLKYPDNPGENVKIVAGWKNFCFDNDIKLGDRIRIQFNRFDPNVGQVFKIET